MRNKQKLKTLFTDNRPFHWAVNSCESIRTKSVINWNMWIICDQTIFNQISIQWNDSKEWFFYNLFLSSNKFWQWKWKFSSMYEDFTQECVSVFWFSHSDPTVSLPRSPYGNWEAEKLLLLLLLLDNYYYYHQTEAFTHRFQRRHDLVPQKALKKV